VYPTLLVNFRMVWQYGGLLFPARRPTMKPRDVVLSVQTPEQEELIRKYHAYVMELDQLALSAPDGQVMDQCELAAVTKGRDITRQTLEQAVQRRIEAAEKKGRR
jgi:hypothetical protein